jgi:hypothetical protein
MPITKFQQQVLRRLSDNRNPESYVAGGAAINRQSDSLRYSQDIDLFHDTDIAVVNAFDSDRSVLRASGYTVDTHIAQPSFYRATVSKDGDAVKLEWVRDTAFRFFPVIKDEELGYRLHDVDLAINKCLALANRSEVRDALDCLELDQNVMSLAATVSAACGKDPGFTPDLMLDMIQRHLNFSPDALAAEDLARPVNPKQLKKDFLELLARTRSAIATIDPSDVGFVFLNSNGEVIKDLDGLDRHRAIRHAGTVKGSWPRIVS